MKRLFCLLLSALAVLSICPMGFGEEAPQGCISLNLESNSSTGYQWEFQSTDEAVASVQALGTTVQQTPLLGAPAMASFQVCGVGAGAAEVRFSYRRSWEEEAPLVSFTLPVTVDGEGNVAAGSEIILFREPDTGWGFEMQDGSILEIEDQGGEEENQAFVLHPLAEGQEEITFTLFSGEGQLPGVLTCRVNSTGDSLAVYEVEYRSAQEDTAFAPDITFTTTDLEGNTVTEQVLAGHSLTILNFWEPWCGPCVAEMPFLQQLSQEYADRGVQVIGVFATPDADEDVRAVLDKTGVSYPILRYVREFGPLQTGYVPTTVVIDGTGVIVYGPAAGALNYAGWCALVEELL